MEISFENHRREEEGKKNYRNYGYHHRITGTRSSLVEENFTPQEKSREKKRLGKEKNREGENEKKKNVD